MRWEILSGIIQGELKAFLLSVKHNVILTANSTSTFYVSALRATSVVRDPLYIDYGSSPEFYGSSPDS